MGSLGDEVSKNKKAMWLYPKVMGFNPPERWGHSACYSNGFKIEPIYYLGVKAGCGGRMSCMATHKVKLLTPEGPQEFECPDDVYILDHAKEVGIDLPYLCRAGSCSSCAGKAVEGKFDRLDGSFLEDDQVGEGWVLTCVAYPQSDVVIETHKEADLTG